MPRLPRFITSAVLFSALALLPAHLRAAESPRVHLRLHSGTSLASPLSAPTDTTDAEGATSLTKPTGTGVSSRQSTPRVTFRMPWDASFFPPAYDRWSRRIGCTASYDLTSRWQLGLGLERVYTPWSGGQRPFGYNPWSTRVTLFASYGGAHFGFGMAIVLHDSSRRSYQPTRSVLHRGLSRAANLHRPPALVPSVAHRPVPRKPAAGCTAPVIAARAARRQAAPIRIGFTPDRTLRIHRGRQERLPRRAVRPPSSGTHGTAASRIASYSHQHRERRTRSRISAAPSEHLESPAPPKARKKVATRVASSSHQTHKRASLQGLRNRAKEKTGKPRRGR